jgi:hypothetical protein
MGILSWFRRDRRITEFTPEELRREESRLQIREGQSIARLERLDRERQDVFRRGFEVKSSVRRRVLARKYEEKKSEIDLVEREVLRLSKEILTVSALRHVQERRGRRRGRC